MTQRCNLKCVHCYAHAVEPSNHKDPISTDQAKAMIDDLAEFGAPVMLFSGGEPTGPQGSRRAGQYAKGKGMRAVISTNGTLITKDKARSSRRGRALLRGHFAGWRQGNARQVPRRARLLQQGARRHPQLRRRGHQGRPAHHHQQAQLAGHPRDLQGHARGGTSRASASTTSSIPAAARSS
jgi:hypothetical protein